MTPAPASVPTPPAGKVVSSGRVGIIVQHDPSDDDLTYKLQFPDGKEPEVDWFAKAAVEVLGGGILPEKGAESEGGQLAGLSQWASSRPAGTPVQDEGFICAGSKAPICPLAPPRPSAAWVPPAGTPVEDESFICMGGMAPVCPAPRRQGASGPITMEVLQGEWVGSGGVQIAIVGTDVAMNGLPLKQHKVQLRDDGTVLSIGTLWQLDKWAEDGGGIEFRASSTRENMECARLEVWTRKTADAAAFSEKMKAMGYAGSAADPLGRGIEGCMPGTSGAEMPPGYAGSKDREEVTLLAALVQQWREPTTSRVCSWQVVPDFTNRAQTGLGVELMHFVATSMAEKGFQKRVGGHGHDIPVVVREPPNSPFHAEALSIWKKRVGEEPGFPPVRAREDQELFTSLGNGHFFQSLNLFATECRNINDDSRGYRIGADAPLREAIERGVPSVVLRHECPRPVRAKIAALLNSKREFFWTLSEDGSVDVSSMKENTEYCSQFEWLSKGMDAVQVDCLVRTHLKVKDSKRIQG